MTLSEKISLVYPGSIWSMLGEDYATLIWHVDNIISKPTLEEIEQAAVVIPNMTVEHILLIGIGSVTSALVYVTGLLWQRSEQCEKDRRELRDEIEVLKHDYGVATGTLSAYKLCPERECPFKKPPARYVKGKAIGEEPA